MQYFVPDKPYEFLFKMISAFALIVLLGSITLGAVLFFEIEAGPCQAGCPEETVASLKLASIGLTLISAITMIGAWYMAKAAKRI